MIHLPKKGYLFGYNLLNAEHVCEGSYGAVIKYLNPKEVSFKISKQDFSTFDYVHGSKEDLVTGKRCVIREGVDIINEHGRREFGRGQFCIHLSDGGVLLILGQTQNGNSLVVYKDNRNQKRH